jgi:transcriptional regulator with XRE-family HTH domain
MDLKEVMAVNVRRIRHDRQLTQEELAHRAGLSARYIGAVERANKSASVTILGRIARGPRRRPRGAAQAPARIAAGGA